jgi:peptidoglycan/LPS O-acetylase OafA/YrhL
MSDLAPGPRKRRSDQRQAILLAGGVLIALAVVRLAARPFTERSLADTMTVRALGATLGVTGFMLVAASRGGLRGAAKIVGSLLGSAVTGAGLAKLVAPAGSLPWLGQLGPPGDALVLLAVGASICAIGLNANRGGTKAI